MLSLLLTAVLRPRQQNPLPKQINEGGSAPERTPEIKPDRSDTLWKQRDGEIASWRRRTGSCRNLSSGFNSAAEPANQKERTSEAETPGRCQRKPQWMQWLGDMTIYIVWTRSGLSFKKKFYRFYHEKHFTSVIYVPFFQSSFK